MVRPTIPFESKFPVTRRDLPLGPAAIRIATLNAWTCGEHLRSKLLSFHEIHTDKKVHKVTRCWKYGFLTWLLYNFS